MIKIILTIYNEEKNIPQLIHNIRTTLKGMNYHIVAVNDGSHDKSLNILNKINNNDITVINHNINLNIGAVFSTGINYVASNSNDNDVVIIMECDQTNNPNILPILINKILLENYDICIASRYKEFGKYKNFPVTRYVYSYFVNYLLSKLFYIPDIKDYTIFFRSYRASILKNLIEFYGPYNFIQTRGFVSNAEILIKISMMTNKIIEVPFIYDYGNKKGKSKMNVIITIIEYLKFIFDMKAIIKEVNNKQKSLAEL